MSTLMKEGEPSYVAYALGRGNGRWSPASAAEVMRYRRLAASPKFVAWRERQEARFSRRRAGGRASSL